jgi:8-oxo-dGTP diphosphatase
MAGRTALPSRRAAPAAPFSIDVVLLTVRERRLYLLAQAAGSGRKRTAALPWGSPSRSETLDAAAARIARSAAGGKVDWIEQAGAFADGTAHPGGALLSVCYVAVIAWTDVESPWSWVETHPLPPLEERQRLMTSAALAAVRTRLEQSPLAFSMLPRVFTLSELQQAYETVLAKRLHKASFRRALQAAFLVEPTGEWRGEGRGRPAQLYRFAPRRRKGARRGVRLDLL